jgi:hypothetical protein
MPYYHVAITKKAGRSAWAFALDMSLETIEKDIIKPLKEQRPFLCGSSMISPTDIDDILISETEKQSSEILRKKRIHRFLTWLFRTSDEEEHIGEWAVVHAGKNVTRKLITGLDLPEEKRILKAGVPEVSKEELKNYLKEFLRLYRSEVKKKYPAYFNEFPFYPALKAIGVISPHHVYIIFTRDGSPTTTTIEVFDESDIPALSRIKDAFYPHRDEVCGLLGVKTYISDLVRNTDDGRVKGLRSYFVEPNISMAVDESITNHHLESVERGTSITWALSGGTVAATVIPNYSFIHNTLDETKLSDKVKDIIERVEEGEVLVAGWIDSYGMRLLNSLTKRNIKFRIVTHKPSLPERGGISSDTLEAFSKLVKEYTENVRILAKLHARLLISDREALVSTADLTKESMESKYEAGISTTDGLAIIQLKEFFEKLWKAGTKLNIPRTNDEDRT